MSFSFVIRKYKDGNIYNYSFAYCFIGSATWCIILSARNRLNVCKKRVPRKLLKLEIVELTDGFTKLHNEVLISFTPHKMLQDDQTKSIKLAKHITLLGGGVCKRGV